MTIRSCVAADGTGTFLSWSNLKDGGLLANNDLSAAKRAFAPDEAGLILSGNRMPAQP